MKTPKFFNIVGLISLLCYAATVIGYALNKGSLNLFLEAVYFIAICGTLLFLGYQIYLQSKKKEIRESTHLLVSAAIFFGILVFLYLIFTKHHRSFDITQDKKYSISEQTRNIVQSLDQEVEFLIFVRRNDPAIEELEKVISRYSYYSKKVSYKFIDPQERPTLAEQYNIDQPGQTIVKAGEKTEKINIPVEEKLTNAILKVTSDVSKRVVFLQGHDETSIEDGEAKGYSLVRRHLELQNYTVSELLLMREEKVPEDVDCLVIASPKKDLFENEIQMIKDYVAAGGSLLLLLDPTTVPSFEKLALDLGFDTKTTMIIDQLSRQLGGNIFTPITMQYLPHPITEGFRVACFFPTARFVDVNADFPEGFTGYAFGYTAPGSWAEHDMDSLQEKPKFDEGVDVVGPAPIMAVLDQNIPLEEGGESVGDGARIIAIGDSNFIDNSYLALSGNKDLFLNTISWLARDENLISIRKTETDTVPLLINRAQQVLIFAVPVVLMPLIVLSIGIFSVLRLRKE